jgi:hypothetical protein
MKRIQVLTVLLMLSVAAAQTTALIRSIESRNRVAFEALLGVTADLNERDELGRSALMVAVAADQLGMMAALLERGAEPNLVSAEGWSALHYAVASSTRELVFELLLAAGADPFIANGAGETPRNQAMAIGNGVAVPLLQLAEHQRLAESRWLRALGVPRPVGRVLGVSVIRRPIDSAGRIGASDDVQVWIFDGAGRPLRDTQVLVLDDLTIRHTRWWSFDETGRLLLVERQLNDLRVVQVFDDTREVLMVNQEGGPAGYAATYRLEGASVRGALAFTNPGGREVSSQLFTFAAGEWALEALMTVGDEVVARELRDAYNLLREEDAFDTTVRYQVVARDPFG